jgi:hypothetical protein
MHVNKASRDIQFLIFINLKFKISFFVSLSSVYCVSSHLIFHFKLIKNWKLEVTRSFIDMPS